MYGVSFIEWKEIENVKVKGKILELKVKKFLRKARIKDEKGKVKKIIEKELHLILS